MGTELHAAANEPLGFELSLESEPEPPGPDDENGDEDTMGMGRIPKTPIRALGALCFASMTNSVRFIHTADLHLDSPLRSLASRNSALRESCRYSPRGISRRIAYRWGSV